MINTRFVDLPSGQRIAVRVREAPSGRRPSTVLLCLHGMPGRGADFDPLLSAMPADWRCLAPDRAGYGDSRPLHPDSCAGPEGEARRLLALLDALAIDRVLLLAWSWAGLVAGTASRVAPDRFRGIMLVGAVGPDFTFPRDLLDRLLFRTPLGSRVLELGARLLPGQFRAPLDAALGEPAPQGLFDRLLEDARRDETRRRWLEDGRALRPAAMQLPPAAVTTWLLHGTADRAVPVAVARATAARRPGTRLIELGQGGHWPFRTARVRTASALVELAAETRP